MISVSHKAKWHLTFPFFKFCKFILSSWTLAFTHPHPHTHTFTYQPTHTNTYTHPPTHSPTHTNRLTHSHTYIHPPTHRQTNTPTNSPTPTHTPSHPHIHPPRWTHTQKKFIHTHITHLQTHTPTHTHTHTHPPTHTHTYTQIHSHTHLHIDTPDCWTMFSLLSLLNDLPSLFFLRCRVARMCDCLACDGFKMDRTKQNLGTVIPWFKHLNDNCLSKRIDSRFWFDLN